MSERFWRKVNADGDCWTWTGALHRDGYGKLTIRGVSTVAHRVAWVMAFGSIPDGLQVLHHCDNPGCVRADHLWLGTPADNMADMASKGRSRNKYTREAA